MQPVYLLLRPLRKLPEVIGISAGPPPDLSGGLVDQIQSASTSDGPKHRKICNVIYQNYASLSRIKWIALHFFRARREIDLSMTPSGDFSLFVALTARFLSPIVRLPSGDRSEIFSAWPSEDSPATEASAFSPLVTRRSRPARAKNVFSMSCGTLNPPFALLKLHGYRLPLPLSSRLPQKMLYICGG